MIVVNYRSPEQALLTATSALARCPELVAAVVVDNSVGHSRGVLGPAGMSSPDPKVMVVPAASNLGFAGGINLGISAAPSSDWYWLLNPDAKPNEGAAKALVSAAAQLGADVVGSRILGADNRVQSDGGSGLVRFGVAKHRGMGRAPDASLTAYVVPWVHGASMLVSRRAWERLGGLEERYFLYFEETDFCFRARQRGFHVGLAPQSVVRHAESSSVSQSGVPGLRDFYLSRNYVHFSRIALHPVGRVLVLPVWFVGVLLVRIGRRQWVRARAHIRGTWFGLLGRSYESDRAR